MASKTTTFEVSLRLGCVGKHTVTLTAPDASDAKRRAKLDASATSGGDVASWDVTYCDRLDARSMRRAA